MEMRKSASRSERGERSRSSSEPASVSFEEISAWLVGRLPEGWFNNAPAITIDRDEMVIIGQLSEPELSDGADSAAQDAAKAGRITRFREETRDQRMKIAREGEHAFGRTISWGVAIGDTQQVFTNLSIPVMTRLRQSERIVLDTLVDSGVARSRSDALAWCVKLVATNADEWLLKLREAMESVETIRQQGPLA
jgi:hypothetical protein